MSALQGRKFMLATDRRIVHRKPYVMPIRFIVLSEESAMSENVHPNSRVAAVGGEIAKAQALVPHVGETVNLSECGVAFKSRHAVSLGQPIELFFTLPTELTGRLPEDVRCTARVVHVDHLHDLQGNIRVGATIERFERAAPTRSWGN
jgi:hypothetical protein